MASDEEEQAQEDLDERADRVWWRWPVLPALLAVAIGAVWMSVLLRPQPPGDRSADAGFARDMSYHHEQAVEMASIVYERTQDPTIRLLAYDILTGQQAQIGMLWGWLNLWGLLSTGPEPPMAWMGHPVEGLMPGMATSDEVALLRTLPPDQADAQFLRLMVRHRQGGVLMAEAGPDRADRATVRSLARGIVGSQRAEITQMQQMLAERGLPPVPDLAEADLGMVGMVVRTTTGRAVRSISRDAAA